MPYFEKYVDDKILSRGLSCYKNGQVTYCEEIAPGEFEAVVEGTEEYEVRVSLRKNKLKDFSCTCPYDYGNICKHIVAVAGAPGGVPEIRKQKVADLTAEGRDIADIAPEVPNLMQAELMSIEVALLHRLLGIAQRLTFEADIGTHVVPKPIRRQKTGPVIWGPVVLAEWTRYRINLLKPLAGFGV